MSPARQLYIAKSGARQAPGIPDDAITRPFGIFGNRGVGKTTTGRVFVEELVRVGGSAIVFDPVGVWWGATRAGEGPGIPGIVLGGDHADVPLEEGAGQLVADLAVGRHWPLIVVDMMLLKKAARQRFLADCLEALYHSNREPLMVVFEEAHKVLPQNPRGMDPTLGRVLGAAEDIASLGRSRGLGVTAISQRFAALAASVREQLETLVIMRLSGPLDRKAAKDWIEGNGDAAATKAVLETMATLKVGEAWMYSPGWLGLLERVKIRTPKTLDSSSAPKLGERRAAGKKEQRAPVDLDALREQMAETVARAEANDPKKLKAGIAAREKKIADLEKRLAALPSADMGGRERIAELEDEVGCLLRAGEDAAALADRLAGQLATLGAAAAQIREGAEVVELVAREGASTIDVHDAAAAERAPGGAQPGSVRRASSPAVGTSAPAPSRPPAVSGAAPFERPQGSTGGPPINGPRQKILDTIAWFEAIGVDAPKRGAVGPLAGTTATSSGFEKNLSGLRTAGLIDYPAGGRLALTPEGRALAVAPEGTPTNAELHAAVLSKINAPRQAILRALIDVYPNALDRAELAERAGTSVTSSGFEKNLSSMRTLELIDYPSKGMVVAADLLFI